MPASRIRSDYEQLNQIAATFGCESERVQKSLNLLRKRQQVLEGGDWVGKGASKFYTEMNGQVLPSIDRLAQALNQAANTTRRINEIMKQTESDAAALFKGAAVPGGLGAKAAGPLGAITAGLAEVALSGGDVAGGWGAPGPSGGSAFVPKVERVLDFVSKWGRNASPFKIAQTYLKLNWSGIKYWKDVSKAAKAGKALLGRIDGLERGARALTQATNEQSRAEAKLPDYPLQIGDKAGHATVTAEELDYVERYFKTAGMIANDAGDARVELDKAIKGWDAALEQANKTKDFTRKAAWEAITDLNLRFNNEGGDFRTYLVDARDRAAQVEQSARMKQYHAAHILGKWTPDWYEPPTPSAGQE